MFNVGPEKLMVVLLIALVVLGPDKLPNAARQIGKYLNEFRRISQGFQQELRSAMDVSEINAATAAAAATAASLSTDPADAETTDGPDGPADAETTDGIDSVEAAAVAPAEGQAQVVRSNSVQFTPGGGAKGIADVGRLDPALLREVTLLARTPVSISHPTALGPAQGDLRLHRVFIGPARHGVWLAKAF